MKFAEKNFQFLILSQTLHGRLIDCLVILVLFGPLFITFYNLKNLSFKILSLEGIKFAKKMHAAKIPVF
jgi:hypothetical protein